MLLYLTYLAKAHFCVFYHFVPFVCAVVKAVSQAVVQIKQQYTKYHFFVTFMISSSSCTPREDTVKCSMTCCQFVKFDFPALVSDEQQIMQDESC